MSGSGHQGLWTEAKYPGDTVRCLTLRRGDLLGDVRIQLFDKRAKVGLFIPGRYTVLPGDTPKCEPDKSEWATSSFAADAIFDQFVQEAYEAGWQNFERKTKT